MYCQLWILQLNALQILGTMPQAISFKIQFNLLQNVSVQTTATALPQINNGIHIATLPEL